MTKKVAKKKVAKKKAVKKKVAKKKVAAKRADLGAPVAGFLAKQPEHLRVILDVLMALIAEVEPRAAGSLKWGMPFYEVEGHMMCGLGAHKAHVNLILAGPPKGFVDPDKRLLGAGKGSRHLRLTTLDEVPTESVRSWLAASAKYARGNAASG